MTQGDPCSRPIYKEENNFLKHKRSLSCSRSPGMEQAQCSARFLAWKWRPLHGPAGPSSLRLSLPTDNTRSGDALAHASGGPWFWECGSLVCSHEESYEWVMAKDLFLALSLFEFILRYLSIRLWVLLRFMGQSCLENPGGKRCRLNVPLNSLPQGETPFPSPSKKKKE